MDYKSRVYQSYRSSFKGGTSDTSLRFGAAKLRPLLEPWVQNLDRNIQVVDIGCGAGELLLALKDLGFGKLGGCDLSAEQVEIASTLFPEVMEADLFTYLEQRQDDSLGLVTAFDVVEHLTRQQTFELMALVRRKLGPDGRFIAHLPNGLSPFVGHVFWGDITHEWCLTPQSARTLCLSHGFSNFESAEHLGASRSIMGKLRVLAWLGVRFGLRAINLIETGRDGGNVWTRNFAFRCDKPNP